MKGMNMLGKDDYVDADTDVTGIVGVILNFPVILMPMTSAKNLFLQAGK